MNMKYLHDIYCLLLRKAGISIQYHVGYDFTAFK